MEDAITYFSDPVRSRQYLVDNRWPDGVWCPLCGSGDVLFMKKRGQWRCHELHYPQQFSVKTGTAMETSNLGFDKWLPALWLFANGQSDIGPTKLARAIGVKKIDTASRMLRQIRLDVEEEGFMTSLPLQK